MTTQAQSAPNPLQIAALALTRLQALMPDTALPLAAHDILFEATSAAYSQAELSGKEESDLLADSIETVSDRRLDMGIKSAIGSVMETANIYTLDLQVPQVSTFWDRNTLDVSLSDDGSTLTYERNVIGDTQ